MLLYQRSILISGKSGRKFTLFVCADCPWIHKMAAVWTGSGTGSACVRFETVWKGSAGLAKHEFVEQKTEELIAPIIEAHHFELVDVEYVKEGSMKYLRVYIDKEGGITVDDCEVISREFNDILDREDYVDEAYVFEVSSPGLGRPLKKDKDFARSLGDEVEVRLFKALNKKKEYTGILKSYDEQTVTITTEDEEDVVFERASIALIRLAFDF